jgi:xanthine dehydrogenase accessory factor
MIGSRRKRDQIYASLIEQGVSQESLDQVYSPIGLDIHSETPAEIAVSIIGQIIQVRAKNK